MSPTRDLGETPARLPAWYGALATLLEPICVGWGQGGDTAAVRARRGLGVPRGDSWIHGASVGEVSGVPPLVAAWRVRRPGETLIASALTPGGRAALLRHGDLPVTAPPYDTLRAARRSVGGSGIRRLLLLETEIWPAWLAACSEAGVKVAVANARLSDRGWPRYRRLGSRLAPLVSKIVAVGAQSEMDAERWSQLGVPADRVRVTGNTKYEAASSLPPVNAAERERARRALGIDAHKVWCVWGSLRPGEEGWLEAALASAPEGVRFLVVPRHPERWRTRRRPGENGRATWLLALGVLPEAYRAGDFAVLGGTLEPYGGHNAVEPAALGLPVLLGPSIDNLREVAKALERSGGARRVSDAAELARAVAEWGRDDALRRRAGESARATAVSLGGASERVLDLLESRGFWS
jgi:3-deoxy-D-manno-octulosonic-acid transferase